MGKRGEDEDGSCPLGIWKSRGSHQPLSIKGGCSGVPKEVGGQSLEKPSNGRELKNTALVRRGSGGNVGAGWDMAKVSALPKRGWMPSSGLAYVLRAGIGKIIIPASLLAFKAMHKSLPH